MKFTSFEVSKKLAEIGFCLYTELYYMADAKCHSKGKDFDDYELKHLNFEDLPKLAKCYSVAAYDLETILQALPKSLQEYQLCIYFELSFESTKFTYNWQKLEVKQNWNESLADTAARLLILLHEKGYMDIKNV